MVPANNHCAAERCIEVGWLIRLADAQYDHGEALDQIDERRIVLYFAFGTDTYFRYHSNRTVLLCAYKLFLIGKLMEAGNGYNHRTRLSGFDPFKGVTNP